MERTKKISPVWLAGVLENQLNASVIDGHRLSDSLPGIGELQPSQKYLFYCLALNGYENYLRMKQKGNEPTIPDDDITTVSQLFREIEKHISGGNLGFPWKELTAQPTT